MDEKPIVSISLFSGAGGLDVASFLAGSVWWSRGQTGTMWMRRRIWIYRSCSVTMPDGSNGVLGSWSQTIYKCPTNQKNGSYRNTPWYRKTVNRPRMSRQHKKAPGEGIFSFSRSGAALAVPLLFCFGRARSCKNGCSGQLFHLLQRRLPVCCGRCTLFWG